jgi:hypothetical protein
MREQSTDRLVGTFGLVRRNERDNMLIRFCSQDDLEAINMWFKEKKMKL